MTQLERVKALIEEKFNGSQAEFSSAIGKAFSNVNQWLNCYHNIKDAAELNIGKFLGLPQGYLDGMGKKYQPDSTGKPIESNSTIFATTETW